jgi:hypothetical protein
MNPMKVATAAVETSWSPRAKKPSKIMEIPPAIAHPREIGGTVIWGIGEALLVSIGSSLSAHTPLLTRSISSQSSTDSLLDISWRSG